MKCMVELMPTRSTLPTHVAVPAEHTYLYLSVVTECTGGGLARHKTMVEGGTVWVWFCLCKITQQQHTEMLRVPFTVQMEESVKCPGDVSTFPTLTPRRASVCLENKLREMKDTEMACLGNIQFLNQFRIHLYFSKVLMTYGRHNPHHGIPVMTG